MIKVINPLQIFPNGNDVGASSDVNEWGHEKMMSRTCRTPVQKFIFNLPYFPNFSRHKHLKLRLHHDIPIVAFIGASGLGSIPNEEMISDDAACDL